MITHSAYFFKDINPRRIRPTNEERMSFSGLVEKYRKFERS
jgi:hypothetical protein